jgi:hypothetical protein
VLQSGPGLPDGQTERRISPRIPCKLSINIEWGSAFISGNVNQISGEGFFVVLDNPLWIGASFAAKLGLDIPVSVDCVVRRVEPRRGMAVTYSVSSQSGQDRIATLLRELTV